MRIGLLPLLALSACVHWTHPTRTAEETKADEQACARAAEAAYPPSVVSMPDVVIPGAPICVPDGAGITICSPGADVVMPGGSYDKRQPERDREMERCMAGRGYRPAGGGPMTARERNG